MRAIDYFDRAADMYGDRVALVDGSAVVTYREVRTISERVARGMWARGCRVGDRVAVWSPNHPSMLLCMLGVMRSGGVWCPLGSSGSIASNTAYLAHLKPTWLFYHSSIKEYCEDVCQNVGTINQAICLDSELDGKSGLGALSAAGVDHEDVKWADERGNPNLIVTIIPTGGSTGTPKAVMKSSLAFTTVVETCREGMHAENVIPICLSVAPLSHSAGGQAFATFATGGTNIVLPAFSAHEVLKCIDKFRVTHLFLPPTALYFLLDYQDIAKFDTKSLQSLRIGGGPVVPERLRQAVETFGPCVCHTYGQIEAPLLTWLDCRTIVAAAAGDHPERLKSSGRPSASVFLAVMDAKQELLAPNKTGEIVVRGRGVSAGYFREPEATERMHADGWHRTGDIGYVDEAGYVYLDGRNRDLVITGGTNVFAAEVEACILTLPNIRECAVIGIPDEVLGEMVIAAIVLTGGPPLTEAEVIRHCRRTLGSVRSPKSVEFFKALPLTGAGKVDKQRLRRHCVSGGMNVSVGDDEWMT